MSKLFDDRDMGERILDKLDGLSSEIVQLKLVSLKQEQNLKEHMKRSDALENYIKIVEQDLKPVKKHVDYINAGLKILGFVSVVAGIVGVFLEIKKSFL